MVYTPGAYWDKNLERHLRYSGYFDRGLTEFSLEIDETGKDWWVVTVYDLEIVGQAPRVKGVVIVDPASGKHEFYGIGAAPDWVDRVMPDDVVKTYLHWRGIYSQGWWNATFSGNQLTVPENPKLIYSASGEPEWVTSITSSSTVDSSLVGVVYTNSRTGESTWYDVKGGGTDSAVLNAVNNNEQVKFKQLHGTDPQVYNIYGRMAAIVPLLNANHAFQGVSIVDVVNPQLVSVGHDQMEAVREYQTKLASSGSNVALDNTAITQTITGIVERIGVEITPTSTVRYLKIKGVPKVFTGDLKLSSELALTQPGDSVQVKFYDSGQDVMPMQSFDNVSIDLQKTVQQIQVQQEEEKISTSQTDKKAADSVRERIKNMSDEEVKKLLQK